MICELVGRKIDFQTELFLIDFISLGSRKEQSLWIFVKKTSEISFTEIKD